MREIIIQKNEAGQRADKFLAKYLSNAEKNFIYKMLRKKNITLNDKKINGNEKLECGDSVKLFFSEDTLAKFTGNKAVTVSKKFISVKHKINFKQYIIYEDANIILMNKPAGLLSQKAKPEDISINEYMLQYLLESGSISERQLATFKPAVCNRLDRNTSGLMIGGTSLAGLQEMSHALKTRSLHKYYLCIVKGIMTGSSKIEGWLSKDEKTNQVTIYSQERENTSYICTEYTPLVFNSEYTLLKVLLVTGKPHQIRAHLSSIGHSIVGDMKYGNKETNESMKKKYSLKSQLLHSYILDFEKYKANHSDLKYLEGKKFLAQPDTMFKKILRGEGFDGHLEE